MKILLFLFGLFWFSSAQAYESNYLLCDNVVIEDFIDYFKIGGEVSPPLTRARNTVFRWDRTMVFESENLEYARLVNVDTDFIAYFTPSRVYKDCELVKETSN